MILHVRVVTLRILCVAVLACSGCKKNDPAPATTTAVPAKHEHHPPHGGTPVVLGEEVYHLEFVLDAASDKMQVYVLDGEMENFIRSAAPSFEVVASVQGEKRTLLFKAVADAATGEKVGDTALFEAQADWLKTTKEFDGVLTEIAIRGSTFSGVKFNFPHGNDHD